MYLINAIHTAMKPEWELYQAAPTEMTQIKGKGL